MGNVERSVIEDGEFLPLPDYGWEERPWHIPLTDDEVATALYLCHGDKPAAAARLKVPLVRLNRAVQRSAYVQRVLDEVLEVVAAKAESIPIATLFDESADARRLEWASKEVRSMRFFQGRPMAPASSGGGNVTITNSSTEIVYTWGPHEEEGPVIEHDRDSAAG